MPAIPELHYGKARVRIFASAADLGAAAAADTADIIRDAVAARGRARLILATGNSQLDMIGALVQLPDVPWASVEVFHMDEYAGMPATHLSSFRYWIRTRVEERVHPGMVQYLAGDAPDPEAEMERYSALLNAAPIDLAFVGFGENGHVAFNDPPVANFSDPLLAKVVDLDTACRRQQVNDGCFPALADVPRQAITITVPVFARAARLCCTVPGVRKAEAVRQALFGPIGPACPASMLRKHHNAAIFLDRGSASLLPPQ